MVSLCISSFEVISELQRKRLCQSQAAVFSWNAQTRGQFLPGSFFSTHAQEPGNEANICDTWLSQTLVKTKQHIYFCVTNLLCAMSI